MSDEHVCVTSMSDVMEPVAKRDRLRPCTRRDTHYASCQDSECKGCVPRPATNGYLCHVCHRRLIDILGRLAWLISHLRSIEKPAQAIGERVDTSMERSILFPDPWIAADELMIALGAKVIPSTADIDHAIILAHDAVARRVDGTDGWVNTLEGARDAVVLIRRFGTALKRWPDSEAELRKIPRLTCPACGWDHLWRQGPSRKGDDERVICGTDECGYSYPFILWTFFNAPIFEAFEKDMKRREREASRARKEAS